MKNCRRRQFFKYAREHFALDALDSYADHPDDLTRLVPNPAKARAKDHVAGARADLIDARAEMADALDAAVIQAGRNGGNATVDTQPPAKPTRQHRPNWPSPRPPPATPRATCPWDRSGPAAGCSRPNASCSPTRSE